MKKIAQLNYQLFLTLTAIIVGSIIAFGMILPISIKYFFDNKIFDTIIESQKQLESTGTQAQNGRDGIYHILYSQLNEPIDKQMDEELLHQRLMYKQFFKEIQERTLIEQKPISVHKYEQGMEVIYYIINKTNPNKMFISYKIDMNNQIFSNQLFMNVLFIIIVTISIILIIFLKWNGRFINNLKDIQFKLDAIGEGHLVNPIKTEHYTIEFQEVMYSLEQMRQKLYENEKIKQDMIHNISHDLKTPLTVIKNYAEGIIDGVYPYGTVEETAHVIYNQADRLQKRVQSLLYLNRLEYLKSRKEVPNPFNIKELVVEVVGYMQDREDKVQIEAYLEDAYFLGDIEKWRVVLENIIDNAKRYAKDKIVIKVEKDNLSIYNDGPPIEERINGSLFMPFEVGQGGVTGLGLSIAKKIVELYGYTIKYRNEYNEGVTFSIYKIT